MNNRTKILLAASLAGAFAMPVAAHEDAKKETAKCYGVNKCKGVGDCGGQGHSCAGKNACKGQGYVDMDKETCLQLEGGSLKPAEPKK